MVVENFSKGFQLAAKVYYLAILPFLTDLFFLTGRALATISPNTVRYGVKFSFPDHFPSLTDFFNFPTASGLQVSVTDFAGLTIITLFYTLALAAVSALISAGYLGKMNAERLGESSSLLSNVSKYFVRILIYDLFIAALVFLAILISLAVPALVLLYLLVFFVIYYFVFLTPFGIVIDNFDFYDALVHSKNLASTHASTTLGYVIVYLILTAVISIPIYAFMNAGGQGFLIATAISALAGTWLVASTLHLYVRITQPPTPPLTLTPPSPPSPQPSL